MRFEGIDALETHFGNHHQDLAFANAARELMLQQVGFTQVEFFPDRPNKVQHAEPHPLPGYVLATGIEANGRIVAQVYPGTPDNHTDLAAFDAWIRAQPDRDDPAQLPSGERGHLHDLYQADDNGISLRHLPEELIFLE